MPFEEAPDEFFVLGGFSLSGVDLASSAFLRTSSLASSAAVSSDSLWYTVSEYDKAKAVYVYL